MENKDEDKPEAIFEQLKNLTLGYNLKVTPRRRINTKNFEG